MVTATLLALAAAVLHASWNLIIKTSTDRLLAAWGQFVAGAACFIPVVVVAGWPTRAPRGRISPVRRCCMCLTSLVRPATGRVALLWAGLTAVVIGSYTVIDAAGARRTDNGFAYGVAVTICAAVTLTVAGAAQGRGREFAMSWPAQWRRYLV